MPDPRFDTPEMLASVMERQQHRASLFQSILSTGGMAGNDELVIVDLSYWQDHTRIDYDLLCENADGFILRATYGIWKDTRFDIHYENFSKRGKPLGAYGYLIGNYTGNEQADAFYQAIDGRHLAIGSNADVEDQRPGTALTRAVANAFISQTDKLMKALTKIYTGPYAWRAIMGDNYTIHKHRPLWIANYMVKNPMMPIGGGWDKFWLWQHTEKGRLPGYYGSLDLNRYNGTKAQWYAEIKAEQPDPLPEEEPLNLPLFSQKDPRWASEKLGTSSTTIGAYGCLITAVAMICKFYGYDTDPKRINQDLIRVGGYESGNLLKHGDVTKIFPNVRIDWTNFVANPQNSAIDTILKRKVPVVAQVDFIPSTPVIDQHWVVIIGKNANGYVIADPIDGKIASLSKFNNRVYRMAVYEHATSPIPPTEEAMYKLEFTGSLFIRDKPFTGEKVGGAVTGDVLYSNEKPDRGWYKVTKDNVTGWVSGLTKWTRITEISTEPNPPEPTLEEKVERLWKAHPELH